MVQVTHHEAEAGGLRTGALDIVLQNRRVISVPTQLGCHVGCTFCVSSSTPLARNLRAWEMVELVEQVLSAREPSGTPIELSFTGEGEGLLNLRETHEATRELSRRHPDIKSVRYSFSGLGAPKLLGQVPTDPLPVRLQLSLHTARQELRDRLIPRSAPLTDILGALRQNVHRFSGVELNVVLQDGINDSDEDLKALMGFGDPAWPILLNPLLTDGREVVSQRTALFEERLTAAGRVVKRYEAVAAGISRQGLYPMLTARPGASPSLRIPILPVAKVQMPTKDQPRMRM